MLYARIKKEFENFKLDIELESNGETLALFGASGCGKSMTLKCIAGVEKPDTGLIVLNDRVLFDSKKKINLLAQDRKVGLLFQSYALFPNMSLRKNLAMGISKRYKNKEEIIQEKIRAFSLEGLENNYPHQLSGGQQQRVALARMLVNEPEILMLDEPFSALDEHLRWQMEQELISTLKDHSGSTLYVSHNKDEVYRICDKIAVFNNGKIEEIRDKEDLFNNPTTRTAAILMGCKNILDVKRVSNNKIYIMDLGLELIFDGGVKDDVRYMGIHTHNVRITSDTKLKNTFEFNILNIIKDLFSYTIELSPVNYISEDKKASIYMELSKAEFEDIRGKKTVFLHFSKKSISLFKD